MPTTATHLEQDRAALRVTLAQDCSEIAVSLRPAQDCGHFEMGGEPLGAQALQYSGGVALVRSQQDCGESVPAASAAHLLEDGDIASHSADRRKRLQMIGSGVER